MSIEETNGVGVRLSSMVISIYNGQNLITKRNMEIDKLPNESIPAYGKMRFGGRIPCQSITHEEYVLTAEDKNSNTIVTTSKLVFQ